MAQGVEVHVTYLEVISSENLVKIKSQSQSVTNQLPATSFPGSLILPPPGANKERPWSGLVMCLPESSRSQLKDNLKGWAG